jgi:cysteine desulfurase
MRMVYMDHAAATPVGSPVIEAMLPYFDRYFGNPSLVYDLGARVKQDLDIQRARVASLIGARPEEIVFTSSGAEANNLAIKGAALARRKRGRRIIISAIEHHSVTNSARFLEQLDFDVVFLPVGTDGLVDSEQLSNAIKPDTLLVSIAHASNEIGTIQAIESLATVCREKGVLFHTDAVATVGAIPVNVRELNVDLLSLSGVSLGAPKGVGALYLKDQLRLMPLIHGGIQENGRRGGTENVAGIVGLGKAAEIAAHEVTETVDSVRRLRDRLAAGIRERIEGITFTGHPDHRLPGHLSLCIEAVEGEALIFLLAMEGIYANTGSACASKALKTSPVLVAIKVPPELAQGSVVFTLNRTNTSEDVDYVLDKLPHAVGKLRSMSPLWKRQEAVG